MIRRAIVAGGGIGGIATAIALQRAGIEVEVFEQAGENREVGAGITLWSNAVRALRRLEMAERILAHSAQTKRSRIVSSSGEVLLELPVDDMSARLGEPSICIHRAELLRLLADGVEPGALHLERRCTGYEDRGDAVTVYTADGREHRADVLIGADGIHSATRKRLRGAEPLRYAMHTCWRGIAESGPSEFQEGISCETWGFGARFGMFHISRGRIYWYAYLNSPEGVRDPEGSHKGEVRRHFTGWTSVIDETIEATPEAAILRNDVHDRRPVRRWGVGRTTLIGDAAHPTTANLGQGACQALESAVILADSLRNREDAEQALRDYERRRFRRTALITRASKLVAVPGQWENPLVCRFRNRLGRLMPAGLKASLFERLFLTARELG